MLKYFIYYIFFTTSAYASYANVASSKAVMLDERFFNSLDYSTLPEIQKSDIISLSSQLEKEKFNERFSLQLDGNVTQYRSDERLLNNFDGGVTRELKKYEVQVHKNLKIGAHANLKLFATQTSNAFITNATTSGVSINFALDLYKNIFGRLTKLEKSRLDSAFKRSKLESKILASVLKINLKKIFWSLVANKEKESLLKNLVSLAEKQYLESIKRLKTGVSDSGEVSRYRSQWTTRKSNLLSIQYRKTALYQQLKEYIPMLKDKELEIGNYNIDLITKRVLNCSNVINTKDQTPLEFSYYDEIIKFIAQEEYDSLALIKSYDSPDLTLFTELASVGRDFDYSASQDDLFENKKMRKSIGLKFSIPIGKESKSVENTQRIIALKKYRSKSEKDLLKISALHHETKNMIKTLWKVVETQKDTNIHLAKSLKFSRKKFEQARISVQELILEEDQQLQSRLSEIDTNLAILNTLMNYFSVFTDFPCDLN